MLYSCTHMTTVGIKGINYHYIIILHRITRSSFTGPVTLGTSNMQTYSVFTDSNSSVPTVQQFQLKDTSRDHQTRADNGSQCVTHDPVPGHGMSPSRLLTNHDEFTTIAFSSLQ